MDGEPVRGSSELRNRIGLVEVDHSVSLDILRDGRRSRVAVRLTHVAEPEGAASETVPALAGATIGDIPPDHPAYGQIEGVLVIRVARGSPAAASGLRRSDIILGVDGAAVASTEELTEALSRGGSRLTLNLLRGNRQLALVIG
jgi:S1-C subfamily serine protease